MKTDFQNGDRLFAEDLNTNFVETDNRLTATETVANAAIPKPSTPSDNQVLTYDSDTSSWVATAPGNVGKVLQVVTATDSTARSTFSGTFVDASISASITPLSATSNLLVEWTLTAAASAGQGGAGGEGGQFRLSDSSNVSISGGEGAAIGDFGEAQYSALSSQVTVRALVAASDTNARTYKGQFRTTGGYNTVISNDKMIGLLTIMEIAA